MNNDYQSANYKLRSFGAWIRNHCKIALSSTPKADWGEYGVQGVSIPQFVVPVQNLNCLV